MKRSSRGVVCETPTGRMTPEHLHESGPMKSCIAVMTLLSLSAVALSGELTATGHDRCVYLRWEPVGGGSVYSVERAPGENGPWERITPNRIVTNVHCDWLGENGKTFVYRVSAVRDGVDTS